MTVWRPSCAASAWSTSERRNPSRRPPIVVAARGELVEVDRLMRPMERADAEMHHSPPKRRRGVADVLLGDREPGGRLPFAIPTDAAHLPHFDPDARQGVYDRWIGQRKLDRDGHRAAYPLGFGLGYTTFAITDLELDTAGEEVRATVRVRNMGARRGATACSCTRSMPTRPKTGGWTASSALRASPRRRARSAT